MGVVIEFLRAGYKKGVGGSSFIVDKPGGHTLGQVIKVNISSNVRWTARTLAMI